MTKNAKKYYRDICLIFPSNGKRKKDYLKHLKKLIEEYDSENENIEYEDLVKEYGSPKEVVSEYYKNSSTDELIRNIYKKKIIIGGFIVLSIILLMIFSCRYYFYYREYQDFHNAIPAYDETTIDIIE